MAKMFQYNTHFDRDLSGWDVGNVGSFFRMFFGATVFNSEIFSNTTNATSMEDMFRGADAFNKPVRFGLASAGVPSVVQDFIWGSTSVNSV